MLWCNLHNRAVTDRMHEYMSEQCDPTIIEVEDDPTRVAYVDGSSLAVDSPALFLPVVDLDADEDAVAAAQAWALSAFGDESQVVHPTDLVPGAPPPVNE